MINVCKSSLTRFKLANWQTTRVGNAGDACFFGCRLVTYSQNDFFGVQVMPASLAVDCQPTARITDACKSECLLDWL